MVFGILAGIGILLVVCSGKALKKGSTPSKSSNINLIRKWEEYLTKRKEKKQRRIEEKRKRIEEKQRRIEEKQKFKEEQYKHKVESKKRYMGNNQGGYNYEEELAYSKEYEDYGYPEDEQYRDDKDDEQYRDKQYRGNKHRPNNSNKKYEDNPNNSQREAKLSRKEIMREKIEHGKEEINNLKKNIKYGSIAAKDTLDYVRKSTSEDLDNIMESSAKMRHKIKGAYSKTNDLVRKGIDIMASDIKPKKEHKHQEGEDNLTYEKKYKHQEGEDNLAYEETPKHTNRCDRLKRQQEVTNDDIEIMDEFSKLS